MVVDCEKYKNKKTKSLEMDQSPRNINRDQNIWSRQEPKP